MGFCLKCRVRRTMDIIEQIDAVVNEATDLGKEFDNKVKELTKLINDFGRISRSIKSDKFADAVNMLAKAKDELDRARKNEKMERFK